MSVILFLLVIMIAVFWHELGHYWLAKLQKVHVNSFSIGMGPVFARWRARGTEWRLSVLPIGGYVEIDGMAPQVDDEGKVTPPKHGYARLNVLGKIAILLAGPLFNVILAFVLLTALFASQGVPEIQTDRAVISRVVQGSTAEQVGVQAGDVITAVNGRQFAEFDVIDDARRPGYVRLQDALRTEGPRELTVVRDGREVNIAFDWDPTLNGERRLFGIEYGPQRDIEDVSVGGAVVAAGTTIVQFVPRALEAFAGLFGRMFTLNVEQSPDVAGPVGAVRIVGQAAEFGVWGIIEVAATINLSLALFNLLPIPGLDGGRILLAIVQSSLRGRLTFEQESMINFAGFAFVILLMVFVVVSDVVNLF